MKGNGQSQFSGQTPVKVALWGWGGGVDLFSTVAAALQVYSMRLGTDGQHSKGD